MLLSWAYMDSELGIYNLAGTSPKAGSGEQALRGQASF